MTWLVALISIPLTIELLGRVLAIRDVWAVNALRPRAFQRLVPPLVWIALVFWIFPEPAWRGLLYGAMFVLAWRWLALAAVRLMMRSTAFQTRSIDLD
jgi:hypothetical protein